MRPLSRVRRAASILLGCWLAIFAAEPAALHVCPLHDGARPAHATHHHQPPPAHHACSCPGTCCPGVGAQPPATPVVAPARIVAFSEPAIATREIVRHADAQVVLPPALGPPAISG